MGSVRIFEAGIDDVNYIADNLRESDMNELIAARGQGIDIHEIVETAWRLSVLCWVAVNDEQEPIMIWGATPVDATHGLGSPWLLGTEEIYKYGKVLLHEIPAYVTKLHEKFPCLINRIDARNTKTIKWLQYLGFSVEDPVPHGPYGMPFRFFHKESLNV